jgi:hypothetical protein
MVKSIHGFNFSPPIHFDIDSTIYFYALVCLLDYMRGTSKRTLPPKIGNDRKRPSPSCRDKGRGGVDEGALCLSSLGYDPFASQNPDESHCHEDKHKAPTLPHLSLVGFLNAVGAGVERMKGGEWSG